ncbi:hypothetical protein PhCBS80983_g04155 [Powellomyces hirtus]|uniref:Uncharacterized protein n=1 Tax=Powellomyces hirtus TaxID=109895 RepID=A0A507DYS3_9FUNG|nr:hypothetical protein PhCBS80983_g04155 [Powellomyces hirtus]
MQQPHSKKHDSFNTPTTATTTTNIPRPTLSASFVMNYTRSQIPKILSERFRRTAHLFGENNTTTTTRSRCGAGGGGGGGGTGSGAAQTDGGAGGDGSVRDDGDDGDGDDGDDPPHPAPSLPPIGRRGRADTADRGHTAGGGGAGNNNNTNVNSNANNGGDSDTNSRTSKTHRREKKKKSSKSSEENFPPVTPYKPFPLSSTSSFSPSSLPRSRRRLAPQTLAKYDAYATPAAEVVQTIDKSAHRARARERSAKVAWRREVEEARAKWGDRDEKEQEGREMAMLARDRMRAKLKRALAMRENEVQLLVEGQQNSIDAILLKEHLALRPRRTVDMRRSYTDDDRVRVDRIVAG